MLKTMVLLTGIALASTQALAGGNGMVTDIKAGPFCNAFRVQGVWYGIDPNAGYNAEGRWGTVRDAYFNNRILDVATAIDIISSPNSPPVLHPVACYNPTEQVQIMLQPAALVEPH